MPDISDLQGPYHRDNRCSILLFDNILCICFQSQGCSSRFGSRLVTSMDSGLELLLVPRCPAPKFQLFKMKAYWHDIDQQQCSPSVSREHKSHEQTAQEDGIVNQPPHSHVIARFLGPKFDVVAQPFCSASSASFSADSEFRRAFARRSHLNPKHLQQMRRCVHCTPIPLHLCQALVNAPHLLEGLGASKLL